MCLRFRFILDKFLSFSQTQLSDGELERIFKSFNMIHVKFIGVKKVLDEGVGFSFQSLTLSKFVAI